MSSGVNMLKNSLKVLDTTKREFVEPILFLNDQKIWQKFCRADLSSASDTLIYWLSTVHKCRDTGLFRHFSNPVFCSLQFQKQVTSEDHHLFESI